jgi:hypothetical protein
MQLGFVATLNAVVFALHFSVGNSASGVCNKNERSFPIPQSAAFDSKGKG